MREIKFRAYSSISEGFIEPIVIDGLTGRLIGSHATLSQYTGLKDKNGVEIYEGDIVLTEDGPLEVRYEVVNEHVALFGYFNKTKGRWHGIGDVEVIGNIYENPNLTDTVGTDA